MKIENLAMIFVIIIIPIALVLSVLTQYQIQTLNTQTLYDNKLTSATYDAMRAYQINANNSTTSELSNSKTRDIEASVSTFKNSIVSSFGLNGYTSDELDSYIPALVYTMYDGLYIYSPYQNIANEDGTIRTNGPNEYGLKPYISYSCRYKSGNIDVVITYSLDNHIAVQGTINGTYVNKDGYLIDGITCSSTTSVADANIKYNDITIGTEKLKEYLPFDSNTTYPYAKINGTKYYEVNNEIVYISNGTVVSQAKDSDNDKTAYKNIIENNYMAKQYYFDAYNFTKWFKESGLSALEYADAWDEVLVKNGDKAETKYEQVWEGNHTKIFQFNSSSNIEGNIENETSQFNQHRLEIIKRKIETNLAIAISNYNSYSNVSNVFQMPELKDDEWDQIINNISLISFLQGMPIGGKVYNGYTLITNSESEEVVLEENIYMLGSDMNYHRIGDKDLENDTVELVSGNYGSDYSSAGRLNLSFTRKYIMNSNATYYYYPLKEFNASYNSIVMQSKVTTYDDIYQYIGEQSDEYKKAFYTALGRERQGKFISSRKSFVQ